MTGLPTSLVQELNVGTVGAIDIIDSHPLENGYNLLAFHRVTFSLYGKTYPIYGSLKFRFRHFFCHIAAET